MKIIILTRYGSLAASSRYRFFAYEEFFKVKGHSVTYQSLFNNNYISSIGSLSLKKPFQILWAFWGRFWALIGLCRYDIIILEKEIFPFLPAIFEYLLVGVGTRFIVDYDDAIFHQYGNHKSWMVRGILNSKIANVMKLSSAVIAGNAYLSGYARDAGSHCVEVIPTVIDLRKFPQTPYREKFDIFTIVWIGSPSTTKYLAEILGILEQVCAFDRGRLLVIGGKGLPRQGSWLHSVEWSEKAEISLLMRSHVGIMPLPDAPWERGKCGFKLIQYMGCFLPVVASPVGVNRDIVTHGKTGFLASRLDEWKNALVYLRDHPEIHESMGLCARRKVEADFSLNQWGSRYVSFVERVYATKNTPSRSQKSAFETN